MAYVPAYKQNVAGTTTPVATNPPPGSIIAWCGTWSSIADDPEGWVVANGVLRTVSDNRYSKISTMCGSGNANSYTPPNLNAAFLRGTGTSPVLQNVTYTGTTLKTFSNHATQTHNHGISDPGHGHYINVIQTIQHGAFAGTNTFAPDGPLTGTGSTHGNFTGITIQNSTTWTDNNETRPYNYGVNWIIKL